MDKAGKLILHHIGYRPIPNAIKSAPSRHEEKRQLCHNSFVSQKGAPEAKLKLTSPPHLPTAARYKLPERDGPTLRLSAPPVPESGRHNSQTAFKASHARLRHLDGWRGASILLVLAGHFLNIPFLEAGKLGVELFFALSGRLIAEILFIERMPLRQFYPRRIARIYPALLVMVTVCTLALAHTSLAVGPKYAAAAALLIYNYAAAMGYHAGAIDHIWSLCVEEHAYITLGLIAALTADRPRMAWWLILTLGLLAMLNGVISTAVFGQDWYQSYWRSDVHIASILTPAVLFLSRQWHPHWWSVRAWMVPSALLLGAACFLGDLTHPPIWTGTIGTIAIAFAVAWLDRAPAWLVGALSWRGLGAVGVLSYSLYLWQQPFYIYARDGDLTLRMTSLAGAVTLALISYHMIENPARSWLNMRFGRWLTQSSIRAKG